MEVPGVRMVVIGGGTGSFTLLSSLKHYTQGLTALVNMADDGGSSGVLRDELGVLPPGDVRQCLVALSSSPTVRDLFNYRFEDGSLGGHAFGNLFMAALEKMTGSFAEAVSEASRVLGITGAVEPITLDPVTLVLEHPGGEETRGEFRIGRMDFNGHLRPRMRLEPAPVLNPKAAHAIAAADLIVIAPGNLYGSLAPALIVPGMSEALATTRAKTVYVCNLMTEPGQTDGFTVADFAAEIERFMGTSLDYVLYNEEAPTPEMRTRYAHVGELPVQPDPEAFARANYAAKPGHFVLDGSEVLPRPNPAADRIAGTRTLIRHDADAVARALMKIYFS